MRNKIGADKVLTVLLVFAVIVLGEGMALRTYFLYAIAAFMLILYFSVIIRRGWKIYISKEILYLLAFLVYSGLSILWAEDASQHVIRVFRMLASITLLTILLTNQMHLTGDYVDIPRLYLIMGTILTAISLVYLLINGIMSILGNGGRLDAVMGHQSNDLALLMATSGMITVYFAIFYKKKILLLLLIPIFLTVMATTSRKGILFLVLGIVMMLYFYSRQKGVSAASTAFKIGFVAAILLLVLILVLQLPMFESVSERYLGLINGLLGNSEESDLSTNIRFRMVRVGWQQFLKTPLFGIGLDNGRIINQRYNNFFAYLHNNYIELLADGGIFGIVLYYAFYVSLLIKHIRRLPEKRPLVYLSFTLLVLRLIMDIGSVNYYSYVNIVYYTFWIAIANRFDLENEEETTVLAAMEPVR